MSPVTGSLRIRNLSVEAVQEFQVNRNAYAAEYGFTAGTAINVVTRSGTNTIFTAPGMRSTARIRRRRVTLIEYQQCREHLSRGSRPDLPFLGPDFFKDRAFFFTSFEALKYDVARFRSYTSNPSRYCSQRELNRPLWKL